MNDYFYVISVINPLATCAFNRQSPESHVVTISFLSSTLIVYRANSFVNIVRTEGYCKCDVVWHDASTFFSSQIHLFFCTTIKERKKESLVHNYCILMLWCDAHSARPGGSGNSKRHWKKNPDARKDKNVWNILWNRLSLLSS